MFNIFSNVSILILGCSFFSWIHNFFLIAWILVCSGLLVFFYSCVCILHSFVLCQIIVSSFFPKFAIYAFWIPVLARPSFVQSPVPCLNFNIVNLLALNDLWATVFPI